MKGLGLDQGQRRSALTHLFESSLDGLGGRFASRSEVRLMPKWLNLYALQNR